EAVATVLAALCGGVVQNTPYIGHPAYKAMGARAGYTFATGLVIGGGAAAGGLSLLVAVLPEAAIAPILVFIGLEITAQGFLASPPRPGAAGAPHGRGGADSPGAPRPRQRLHPDVRHLGLGARDDHRATLRCDRSLVRLCERGGALRCDPFARADRRALLALGAAFHRARAPGRRLRRARGGLLARGNA